MALAAFLTYSASAGKQAVLLKPPPDDEVPTPAPGPTREQLSRAIAAEETRLGQLERERVEAQARLTSLRSELVTVAPVASVATPEFELATTKIPRTGVEKIKLFRRLFLGREDVFPVRFVSRKTGKPGYGPECRNKFVPGICGLPAIKCSQCTNQGFVPIDDAVVRAHLQGRHVMGVYPLLKDETCWFLAIDFDGQEWAKDVGAFVETCHHTSVPAAVERSRSGDGAHVWFFFSAPVAATSARKMGCFLLTETMHRRHQLRMESYDRLFPSQDTMPKGGFGNLIALPLQHGPRQLGNSAFVDENLAAFPGDEQWTYLARIQKLAPKTVEMIAADASRRGSVIGVRLPEVPDDDDAATPWLRLPSGRRRQIPLSEPVPAEVRAVLAQRLFVEKAGLPSALVNQLKRVAAFQNPVFYRRQSLRLSTAMTPRVIACAEELEKYVALPRACQSEIDVLLRTHGAALRLDDRRHSGGALDVRFHGVLTDVQDKAAQALLAEDIGILVAPPATGKTVVGTYLVAARGRTTLVLVNRQTLMDQWRAQLAMFLGLEPGEIGQIGGGKRKPTGRIDVAMLQSLVRKDSVDDLVATYGQIIIDECHHLPARSFDRVLSEVKARFVVGLTATPHRKDGHHPIMEMQLGPVRFSVDAKSGSAKRPFEHRLIVRETLFPAPSGDQEMSIQSLYSALAAHEPRNQMILDDLLHAVEEGRSPLLLTERREHLELLKSRLQKLVRHLVVLHGGMGAKRRREILDRLAAIPRGEERVLLATGRYIGEGFDDSRLDTLFLALPVSWKGTLVQYTGRLHRLSPGKAEVRLYDYVDRQVPMPLKMFERRLRAYRAIGYARGEAPLGFAERPEPRIEYDEDVLRELRRNEEPW